VGPQAAARPVSSRRWVVPSVCILDAKQHIRAFLGTALEEFGFIVCECPKVDELAAVLDARPPDLALVRLSAGETEITEIIKTLATKQFDGLILLAGPQNSPMISAGRELAEGLGLALLPTLATPFASDDLRNSVAAFLPIETPSPPVDAAEALRAGWLELWYQPKIHAHKLTLEGAEALIRMRHPDWGIVEPAYFIPDDVDPHFQALSEFVISRATADWRNFVAEYGRIDISINLPITFLQSTASVRYLYEQLPDHPAFAVSSSRSTAPTSFKIYLSHGTSPSRVGFTRSPSR
jgi:DNA-binding response OmpR family regulator